MCFARSQFCNAFRTGCHEQEVSSANVCPLWKHSPLPLRNTSQPSLFQAPFFLADLRMIVVFALASWISSLCAAYSWTIPHDICVCLFQSSEYFENPFKCLPSTDTKIYITWYLGLVLCNRQISSIVHEVSSMEGTPRKFLRSTAWICVGTAATLQLWAPQMSVSHNTKDTRNHESELL